LAALIFFIIRQWRRRSAKAKAAAEAARAG
jgi:hypothetical protein